MGPAGHRGDRAGLTRVRRARARPRARHRPAARPLPDHTRAARTRHAPTVAPARPATDPLPPALPLGDTELEATAPDAEVPAAQRLTGAPSGLGSQLRRLGRHSAIYGIGGLVSRVIAVLLLPVRYLTLDRLRANRDALALTTVMGLVLRAGDPRRVLRFYFDVDDDEGRLEVLRTSFWFTMGGGTLSLALLLVLAGPVSTVSSAPTTGNLVRASGVALWATVNYEQPAALFRVEERSFAFVCASLANVFLTIGITLLLVVGFEKGRSGSSWGTSAGPSSTSLCSATAASSSASSSTAGCSAR